MARDLMVDEVRTRLHPRRTSLAVIHPVSAGSPVVGLTLRLELVKAYELAQNALGLGTVQLRKRASAAIIRRRNDGELAR